MQAIVLKGFGGIDQLSLVELPTPVPSDGEVLVEVHSISINPIDVKTRAGRGAAARLKNEAPIILGWDMSGVVRESRSGKFKVGDEVFGVVRFPGHGKAYAGFMTAPELHLALKPLGISHNEAAAAGIAALTAWQVLVQQAKITRGQKVLIHAAAGGVGHYAVQMAKHLGAYVIGTASAANRDFVLELGADEHVDYRDQPLSEKISDVDFVLDTIGGDNIDASLPVIKKGGTIISIPSGLNEQVVEKAKAFGVFGSTFLVQASGDDMQKVAGWLAEGAVRSMVSRIYPFAEMGAAHLQIESGRTRGKIVLTLS